MPKVEIGATIGDRRNGARGSVRFGSKADIAAPPTNVRFIPKADIGTQPCDIRFVPEADIAISSAVACE